MEVCWRRRDLRKLTMNLTVTIMAISVMIRCVSGELHRVGGKKNWNPNVNYTEWARDERFYVDDWLIFYFDKNMYNVLEVNKSNYESCSDQEFITNITKGGRDVFHLSEARSYYFLSGRGFCWSGMKVAILVQNHPAPPAQAPAPNGLPPSAIRHVMITVLISAFLILFGLWNQI